MATTIRIDPVSKKVHLEFSWDESGAPSVNVAESKQETSAVEKVEKKEEKVMKEYTMDEVAKHTTKDDCWVVISGQVLDVTNFLPDRAFSFSLLFCVWAGS